MTRDRLLRAVSDEPAARGSRLAEIVELLAELEEHPGEIGSGDFNALAMMIVDAALDADDASLTAAQDGLKRLYGLQPWLGAPSLEQVETRGRVLGLVDLVQWMLRRVVHTKHLTRIGQAPS